jgi:hypothetical protein
MNNDNNILAQYPKLEFSYETITHKKIPSYYDICLAIPHAKKCVIWFTFHEGRNKCVLIELNRAKTFSNVEVIKESFVLNPLYLGTVIFGSFIATHKPIENNNDSLFIIEDLLMHEGVVLNKMVFGEKLVLIENFLNVQKSLCYGEKPPVSFYLPVFWKCHTNNDEMTNIPYEQISYPLHHIQYRSFTSIVPHLNFIPNNDVIVMKPITKMVSSKQKKTIYNRNNNRNEQTKYKSTFIVKADPQTDVYNLYAYDEKRKINLYDVAYIPNCKSSVYMNSLFRNIKENYNLDLIEESDDEDDFEDVREDKYVDTNLEIVMDCVYHTKFKRWVPIKVLYGGLLKVISLSNLPIL